MKERRVKVDLPDGEVFGDWIDNVAIGGTLYGVVVADDNRIYGAVFNLITLIPDSENFKE